MTPCSSGNLADHRRQQVGLAQAHGAGDIGLVGVGDMREQGRDHGLHAVDLVGQAADVGVEDDLPEVGDPGAQGHGAILVQKNRASARRARSTRSLPPTIAAPPSVASRLATKTKRGAMGALGGC